MASLASTCSGGLTSRSNPTRVTYVFSLNTALYFISTFFLDRCSKCKLRDVGNYQKSFDLLDAVFRFHFLAQTNTLSTTNTQKQKSELRALVKEKFGVENLDKLVVDVFALVALAADAHASRSQPATESQEERMSAISAHLEEALVEIVRVASGNAAVLPSSIHSSQLVSKIGQVLQHMEKVCFAANSDGTQLVLACPAMLVSEFGGYIKVWEENVALGGQQQKPVGHSLSVEDSLLGAGARSVAMQNFEENSTQERRNKLMVQTGVGLGLLAAICGCVYVLFGSSPSR